MNRRTKTEWCSLHFHQWGDDDVIGPGDSMLTSSDQAEVAVPPDRWASAGQRQETLSLFARPHGWSSNGRSVRDGEFRTARSEKPALDGDEETATASTTTTSIEELLFGSHSETNATPVPGEAAYAYGNSDEDLRRDAKNVTNFCGRCPPEGVGRRDDVTDPPELSGEAANGLSNGSSWGSCFAATMSSRDGSNSGLAFRDGGTGLTGHDVQAPCSPPLGGGELWDSGVTVDAGGSQVSESESQSGESDVTTADAYRAASSSLDALVTSSGTESMLDQYCTSARDDDDGDDDGGGGGGGGSDDGLNIADSYTIGKQINGGDGLSIAGSYTIAKQSNSNVHTMNSPVNEDDDDSGPTPARVDAPLLLPPLVPLPATRDDGDVSSNPSLSADAVGRGASVKAATLTPADGAASTTRKSQLLSPPSRKKGGAASKENVCGRSRDRNRVDKHGGNVADVTSGDRAAAARTTRSKGVTAAAGRDVIQRAKRRPQNSGEWGQRFDVTSIVGVGVKASRGLHVQKTCGSKGERPLLCVCSRLFRFWM